MADDMLRNLAESVRGSQGRVSVGGATKEAAMNAGIEVDPMDNSICCVELVAWADVSTATLDPVEEITIPVEDIVSTPPQKTKGKRLR